MPVQEFICRGCKGRFDAVESIKAKIKERRKCPDCGKTADLIFSKTAPPVLIGRGFHANDYHAPTRA